MPSLRRRTSVPLLVALALAAALCVALYLRAKAPPEAARLLPESDAIVYVNLKPIRAATHFDQTPVTRSAEFQRFIDATGIVPERDLDSVAFALHRMPDPRGPNGPVAYSEVFVGRFDGVRLAHYLNSLASARESYAGRTIYTVPIQGRTLRLVQLGYDTLAASNMPTPEQIHSMLDRSRASALGTPGSSLLAARYHEVPLLSEAWGIGHIGLPFSQDGVLQVMGLELPVPADTSLVASLRYVGTPPSVASVLPGGSVQLRVEEFAPDEAAAQRTVEALNTLLALLRGLGQAQPPRDAAAAALRSILSEARIEQHSDRAELDAHASVEQLKAIFASHPAAEAAPAVAPLTAPAPPATPREARASKRSSRH